MPVLSPEKGGVVAMPTETVVGILTLPGNDNDVAHARRFVRHTVRHHPDCDTAVLLTSELVTNSIVHGSGAITVVVAEIPDGIRVEVRDAGGRSAPRMRISADTAEGGRGLFLVDHLSTKWDHLRDATGLTSWFELRES